MKGGKLIIAMTPSTSNACPHALPQLPRGERAGAGGPCGAGGAERRRQDQLPGGDLVSVAGRGLGADAGGCRRQPGRRSWAVSAEVEGALGLATLGTGIDAPAAEASSTSRRCRIDREPVSSATASAITCAWCG